MNYTDRAAAAGRRSQCQLLRIEGCHVVSATGMGYDCGHDNLWMARFRVWWSAVGVNLVGYSLLNGSQVYALRRMCRCMSLPLKPIPHPLANMAPLMRAQQAMIHATGIVHSLQRHSESVRPFVLVRLCLCFFIVVCVLSFVSYS
jgi:hypothetical protein